MKRSFILWWAMMFVLAGSIKAQQITLHMEQVSLDTLLAAAEKQLNVRFVFSKELSENAGLFSVSLKKASLTQFLHAFLRDRPISYFRKDPYIVLHYIVEKPGNEETEVAAYNNRYHYSGMVVDETGQPQSHITIRLPDFPVGTITDSKGVFRLDYDLPETELLFSGIGFSTRLIRHSADKFSTFQLQRKSAELEEAVVKGYYSTKASSNTGSVATISSNTLDRQPVNNVLSALQGRVSGVYINTLNGLPGGNIAVLIRGPNSLNAGNEPLYLIDGIPFEVSPLNNQSPLLTIGITGPIHPLTILPVEAIESVRILKDGDATAIYGARSGNGVVLIETKKAKKKSSGLSFRILQGVNWLNTKKPFLSLPDYLAYRKEAFYNDGTAPTPVNAPELTNWDSSAGINWKQYLFGELAPYKNASLEWRQSSRGSALFAAVGFRSEGSVSPGTNSYSRASLHLHYQFSDSATPLQLQLGFQFAVDKNSQYAISGMSALTLPPNIPLFTQDGDLSWKGISTNAHPYAMRYLRNNATSIFVQPVLKIQYRLLNSLALKINLGGNGSHLKQVYQLPRNYLNAALSNKALPSFGKTGQSTWIGEMQLHYHRKLRFWNMQTLLGISWQSGNKQHLLKMEDVNQSAISLPYRYASIFGQYLVSWKERIHLNAVVRRDASSRFGPDNRAGNFGAVGIAWNFSTLKFRSSVGFAGNDQIGDFIYQTTYNTSSGYNGESGLRPERFQNTSIGWEKVCKWEWALEGDFFKKRLFATVAFYHHRSTDQIVRKRLPFQSGPFGIYISNHPVHMRNQGWELDLQARLIQNRKWDWMVHGGISRPANKLIRYPDPESSADPAYLVGYDISSQQGYEFLGVDPSNGLPLYSSGQVVIGKTSPDWFGGFGSSIRYGKLELKVFFQYSAMQLKTAMPLPGSNANLFESALNRWQTPGDQTTIPLATNIRNPAFDLLPKSTAVWEDASYLRFKSVSIVWKITRKINCFTEGMNLITWSKKGNYLDPETNTTGVPPLQTCLIGIQIQLK